MINDYEATKPMTTDAIPAEDRTTLDNDEVISTLNGLIETCKDGEEGYREAAEGADSPQLKEIFYQYSQQRSQFLGELQSLVRSLGGDPETSGSFTGAIHRGWINIKTAIAGNDDKAVLNECERGEDGAKHSYKAALENALPANVSDVVQQQFASIVEAHDRIRMLRDSANAGNSNFDTARSAGTGF